MNDTLRRTWPSVLVVLLALLYVWIGVAAHGWDRTLGLGGGVVILAAIAAARQAVPGAYALLVIGALPLAIVTWWSITTPVLAILILPLGWTAVRHLRQPRTGPTSTASESAA